MAISGKLSILTYCAWNGKMIPFLDEPSDKVERGSF